jgi:hypothetical protein
VSPLGASSGLTVQKTNLPKAPCKIEKKKKCSFLKKRTKRLLFFGCATAVPLLNEPKAAGCLIRLAYPAPIGYLIR